MSIESIGSSSSNLQMGVALMNISKNQEEAVMGKLLESIESTGDIAQRASESRELFPTGHKLNVTA